MMKKHSTLDSYNDFLLPKDVQAILQISRSTLYKYLADGTIKSIRIGSLYRIPRSFLDSSLSLEKDDNEMTLID